MKKYFIFAITIALISTLSLALTIIFLDPLTAVINWFLGGITYTACFICFLLHSLTNPQSDENTNCTNCINCARRDKQNYIKCDIYKGLYAPKYCRDFKQKEPKTTELNKVKTKIKALQEIPYKGSPSSIVQINKRKGMEEGLKMALEIIEEVETNCK